MEQQIRSKVNSDPVILVACCGPKLPDPSPAADLFISDLFKKARTYAERSGRWFILSALHGLLDPLTVIAPYDVTLKRMPAAKRREWGRNVRDQMEGGGVSRATADRTRRGGLCETPSGSWIDLEAADEGVGHW